MKCPECNGLKILHIPAEPDKHWQYDITCPTCEGAGELPDPIEFPNNCPACGEPIRAGQKWCDHHKEAERFTHPENPIEEAFICSSDGLDID